MYFTGSMIDNLRLIAKEEIRDRESIIHSGKSHALSEMAIIRAMQLLNTSSRVYSKRWGL